MHVLHGRAGELTKAEVVWEAGDAGVGESQNGLIPELLAKLIADGLDVLQITLDQRLLP